MKYRTFAKTGEDISLFGFGAMRLPQMPNNPGKIDEDLAIRMIRYAIDNGVNYVDTAFMYHGGESEVVVGKALRDGYREKVFLADKLPVFMMNEPKDMQKVLDTQLERLGTKHIDFCLVHNIAEFTWERVKEWDIFGFLKEKQAEGVISHIGFSYHGERPGLFNEVIDAYPWEFCQIQLNYMDTEIQAGLAGLYYAKEKGVPVIIMEPLKGGKLTDSLPPSIRQFWDELKVSRSPAEWALRWVANFPEVMTILSGVSTMEQAEDNVRIFSSAEAGSLTEDELSAIEKAAAHYNKLIAYPCTACKYCLPCPAGIDIPSMISYRNSWELYGGSSRLKAEFRMSVTKHPSECTSCKKCESKCPQHLSIAKAMRETTEIYE